MKYINTFESFKIDNNKLIFINYEEEEVLVKDEERLLSKEIKNKIQDVFFKTIHLKDYNKDTIDNLKFKENDIVYCLFTKNLGYDDVNKTIMSTKLYKKLKFDYNIHAFMNDEISASKVLTQKIIKNKSYYINTVFDRKEVKDKIGFPVVAKPDHGSSGLGISVFKSESEMNSFYKKNPKVTHDLYSEFVDYSREFRVFCIKDKILSVIERLEKLDNPLNISNKKIDQHLNFIYVEQNIEKLKFLNKIINIVKDVYTNFLLDVYSVDIFLTKNGGLKLIEINAGTGINAFRIFQLYKGLIYIVNGDKVSKENQLKINKLLYPYKQHIIQNYEKEISKSLEPIDFNDENNDYKIY